MKKSKASKPIIAISMAILTMSSLPLYGCGSEQPGKTSSVSIKSSSISASSVKTSSDSDMDKQKEEKEDTKEKSNTDASKEESTSEVSKEENSEEPNTEVQEDNVAQAPSEESTAEAESVEVPTPNDNPEPAPTEQSEDPGDISGRLYIPDLGINVGLYMVSTFDENEETQQIVCNAEDSAVYLYDYPGRALIGDHCYQDFSSLYNSYIGMPVYIYGQEYVCVENGWGINTGNTIIVENGDVQDINDGLTVLYTCASRSDSYDVWYVTVAPV